MRSRWVVILAIAAATVVWGLRDGPAARQRRGMAAARAFVERVAPTLAADPRFAAVQTGVTTHPAVRVYGDVPDQRALHDLTAIVTAPPDAAYRVMVNVKVVAVPATRPAR